MKIVLWGATGLIGSACLARLLEDERVSRVVAPTRKPLEISAPKLDNPALDFARLESLDAALAGARAGISCLGTTIRKAGSRQAFRQVDYDYSLAAAEHSRAAGVTHWLQVTAIGSSSRSPIFYNRVKGELEGALKSLGFPMLSIFHPSMLMGERSENRPLEVLGIYAARLVNPLLIGPLRPYRGIEDRVLAQALVNHALQPLPREIVVPVNVFSYEKIATLAAGKTSA